MPVMLRSQTIMASELTASTYCSCLTSAMVSHKLTMSCLSRSCRGGRLTVVRMTHPTAICDMPITAGS